MTTLGTDRRYHAPGSRTFSRASSPLGALVRVGLAAWLVLAAVLMAATVRTAMAQEPELEWQILAGETVGEASFRQPQGVAVDGAGNVYVADTGNHRIQKGSLVGVP